MSAMYFAQFADVDGIIRMIRPKISALIANSPRGITIDVKKTQRNRTTEQNRYLFAIYKHIVEFYNQTGFIPDNLPINGINSDFLHQYFKARFDVKETKNMNTRRRCRPGRRSFRRGSPVRWWARTGRRARRDWCWAPF